MAALEDKAIWEDGEEMDEEVLRMQTDEIVSRARLLDNEIKIMKSEIMRINHEQQAMKEKIKVKCSLSCYDLPSGVLLYGPPGTGKTLMARACAAQTKSTFLKLAGPQLVQMFIGDGAKLVRDAFALAKEKTPAIIFIDELDAIGTKRFDSEKAGDREVQRTMLELLNQLDGFSSHHDIKVVAATNRVDILDPALLRSGLNSIIISLFFGFQCFQFLKSISREIYDWNCSLVLSQGMIALRREATEVIHEDYMDGIMEVNAKKKANLMYYA
ncbi:26S protease regulatory subunit 6A-like [Orbicella faveolata]|uniref:26S protease regulatory subunit 6A-like n=1 Tax=Orbicella faveolata TaxID=48498 RepID=UPI0009E40961|nr:26S protease regulatory subunit 6A-like [Orbicella faveolata]